MKSTFLALTCAFMMGCVGYAPLPANKPHYLILSCHDEVTCCQQLQEAKGVLRGCLSRKKDIRYVAETCHDLDADVKMLALQCPDRSSEWGINARVEGIGFGGDSNNNMAGAQNASMGGFGLSLRYRPKGIFNQHIALDTGFDVFSGLDLNGFQRVETPFSLNGLLYLNPHNTLQLYIIGGVNWSRASVRSDSPSPLLTAAHDGTGYSADYKYFGGQLGVGLEFRLSRRLAFNVDALGFMRSRSDIKADDDQHNMNNTKSTKAPEFINAETGQTTNTSGGGLFRGGLTLWW